MQALREKIAEAENNKPKYIVTLDLSNSEVVNNMYKLIKDKKFTRIALTGTPGTGDGDICSRIGFTTQDSEWRNSFLTITGWDSKTSSSENGAKCIERIKGR